MSATASLPSHSVESKPEPLAGNYFIAAYPPFSAWEPQQNPAMAEALQQPPPASPVGLYIHIPFCARKCDYCYYLSYIDQRSEVVNRYLDSVVREMQLYAGQPALQGRPVSFVYFGGGTPSTLSSTQVRRLADGLKAAIPWKGVEEVTFECAPRSVRREFLEALREIGVTRLSMGVQSFDDRLLKMNGRVHLAEDVVRACTVIQDAGFDWVNLDLMVGLVGETFVSWRDSVRQAIALGPDSITVYQTEIPHNTQLYRDLKAGHLPGAPVPWNEKRTRLNYAFTELDKAGYRIISGYNAIRNPARHQFRYQNHLWHGGDMLGLGVASFGYFGGVHFQNAATLESYTERVEAGELPWQRSRQLTPRDRLVREFILQLKMGEVRSAKFREKFSIEVAHAFAQPLRDLAGQGFLTWSESGVRLTPAGLLCVDRLLPRFYDPQFRESRYT